MRFALGILAVLALSSCSIEAAEYSQEQLNRMYLSQKSRTSSRAATARMNRSRQAFRNNFHAQAYGNFYNRGGYYRYYNRSRFYRRYSR
jgi:hypothetical protein